MSTTNRTASLAVGAAVVVWDRLVPREPPGWRHLAVGALFAAQDAAGRAVRRPATLLAGVRAGAGRLARRGAVEEDIARRRALAAADALVAAISTAPLLDRVVDAQLDRVLRPLVAAVLDDVLAILEAEPQRVQAVIRGQRTSLVDELVDRIRTGARAGDATVDAAVDATVRSAVGRWTTRPSRGP
jgi:hypothetical protein